MKVAIYPGSFDPFHNGHLDVALRAANVFDRIVVGVLNNPEKSCSFTPEERITMIREALGEEPRIEVQGFDGLVVDFAREVGATALVRGDVVSTGRGAVAGAGDVCADDVGGVGILLWCE